ncbi:MAG: chemotaxis protein CheW [Proteobacteria bacterium]|nr:chemotaxis protein CheW [Pseudomonadota bacterium]
MDSDAHTGSARARADAGKYLTFTLADEVYGLRILKVREIFGLVPITPVPQTPYFLKGVINLRGQVIPVVDLRLKFGMVDREYTDRTSIIVLDVRDAMGRIPIGVIVDAVADVVSIDADDIEPAPSLGSRLQTRFIAGMAKLDSGIKILLDVDAVLSAEEMGAPSL